MIPTDRLTPGERYKWLCEEIATITARGQNLGKRIAIITACGDMEQAEALGKAHIEISQLRTYVVELVNKREKLKEEMAA